MTVTTIAQRIIDKRENKPIKPHYRTTCCAVFRNVDTYFSEGITFSRTGVYAPTFRLNCSTVYDTEGSTIILEKGLSTLFYLGVFTSKLTKYLMKTIGHTVHCQVDELKELPIVIDDFKEANQIIAQVKQIVSKQKKSLRYDYAANEQVEIDSLVYKIYGLSKDDIQEVENWYARRYPRLNRA